MRPRQLLAGALLALGLLSLGTGLASAQPTEPGPIDIVEIEGLIDPPVARFIIERIAAAERDGAQLVLMRVDSPAEVGVERDALFDVVSEASVPIVMWAAPRGAVAENLAGELFNRADAAFRASETTVNLGPVMGGIELEQAFSLTDVLQAIDGMTLEGNTIESWDAQSAVPGVLLRFQELPLWDRLLHAVTTPTSALFLILLGAFGLIFETYNPGIGVAAGLGAILLTLGFYALDVLPTNWWALLIITVSLIALVYEVHVAGFGVFTVAGLIGIATGSTLLFSGFPALDVHLGAIVSAVVLTIVFFVSVMTAALRVRLRRPIDDSEGIVGSIAEAQTDIAPEGTVLSNGTLWRARTMETGIAAGSKVEVKATEGLVLLVEPLHEG